MKIRGTHISLSMSKTYCYQAREFAVGFNVYLHARVPDVSANNPADALPQLQRYFTVWLHRSIEKQPFFFVRLTDTLKAQKCGNPGPVNTI